MCRSRKPRARIEWAFTFDLVRERFLGAQHEEVREYLGGGAELKSGAFVVSALLAHGATLWVGTSFGQVPVFRLWRSNIKLEDDEESDDDLQAEEEADVKEHESTNNNAPTNVNSSKEEMDKQSDAQGTTRAAAERTNRGSTACPTFALEAGGEKFQLAPRMRNKVSERAVVAIIESSYVLNLMHRSYKFCTHACSCKY